MAGIRRFGGDRFTIETCDIDAPLPGLIEDAADYLPGALDADLVLDHLNHPDLSHDLWGLCRKLGIPVIASNKRGSGGWAVTPRICCALHRGDDFGEYGRLFGSPEFRVSVAGGRIAGITVLRGAPCGASWEAAEETVGIPTGEAPAHIGLKTQYFCKANPAGWDVMHGRSPVHLAAELHAAALRKALERVEGG